MWLSSNIKKLPSTLCFNCDVAQRSILGWMKSLKQRSLLIHPGPSSFKFKMESPREPSMSLSSSVQWQTILGKKPCPLEGQDLHPIDLLSFAVCFWIFLVDETGGKWHRKDNNGKIHPESLAWTWPFQVIKINNYLSSTLGSLFPVKWIGGEKKVVTLTSDTAFQAKAFITKGQ